MGSFKIVAERQGFEPWEGCPSTVFKTAAIDRSAISPSQILSKFDGKRNENIHISSKSTRNKSIVGLRKSVQMH
jgi:hypothetical protein